MLISHFIDLVATSVVASTDTVAPGPAAEPAFLTFAETTAEVADNWSTDTQMPESGFPCASFPAVTQGLALLGTPLPSTRQEPGTGGIADGLVEARPGSRSAGPDAAPLAGGPITLPESGEMLPMPANDRLAAEIGRRQDQGGPVANSRDPARPITEAACADGRAGVPRRHEPAAVAGVAAGREAACVGARHDQFANVQGSLVSQPEDPPDSSGSPAAPTPVPETRAPTAGLPRQIESRTAGEMLI